MLEVCRQRLEIPVDQVHDRPREGESIRIADRIHHPKIDIGHMAEIPGAAAEGKEVSGVGIGMEVSKFQQLLQSADHPCADQSTGVEAL